MRDALICLSLYAKDGRGTVVRGAGKLTEAPGPVFCRYEQLLLINGPTPGKTHPDVVGWIAEEDAADLLSHGEFRKVQVEEAAEEKDVPAPAPPDVTERFLPPNVMATTPQED